MTKKQLAALLDLAESDGRDAALAAFADLQAEAYEAECESREIERFERDAYGDMSDDGLSSGQREYNDRLDMGRNDAGEWLGFM
jgi:hypothetical protein